MNIFDKYLLAARLGNQSSADFYWASIAYFYFNDIETYDKYLQKYYGVRFKRLWSP